jgi:hypothetical protein
MRSMDAGWLRADIVTARGMVRRILSGRVIVEPSLTEHRERIYLLRAKLALGDLIPRGARTTVNVPDGI